MPLKFIQVTNPWRSSNKTFMSTDLRYMIEHQKARPKQWPGDTFDHPARWTTIYNDAAHMFGHGYTGPSFDAIIPDAREQAEAWCEQHALTAPVECAGCLKPIIKVVGEYTYIPAYVELPNGARVAVCAKYQTRHNPRDATIELACHRKLKLRWHFCAGCGVLVREQEDRGIVGSMLCAPCTETLKRGKARDEDKAMFTIGHVGVDHHISNAIQRRTKHRVSMWDTTETIIKIANPELAAQRIDSWESKTADIGSGSGHYRVELTHDQAEAADTLMKAIGDGIQAAYLEGHADGRNALMGLANGALTVDDLAPTFAKKGE